MVLKKKNMSDLIIKAGYRCELIEDIEKMHRQENKNRYKKFKLKRVQILNQINVCKDLIGNYNRLINNAEKKSVELKNAEAVLGDLYTNILAEAISKFGLNSKEVEMLK
jgi:hypothetical protein